MRKKSNIYNKINAILLLILGLFFLFPFYIIIVNSLKTRRELYESVLALPIKAEISNYIKAFDRMDLLNTYFHSFVITLSSILVIIIFSSMAAYMLQRTKTKTSTFIFLLFVIVMVIPFQTIMIPLIAIMGRLGFLNMPGLVFMYLGFASPMAVFLYHGYLKSIPKDLDEAAMIDGCSVYRVFWSIIFPLLKPMNVTVAILDTIYIWNDFLLPSLVIYKKNTMTIPLKTYQFFGQYTKEWNIALPALVFTIIPVVIFFLVCQRYVIKSIISGSVKA